MSDIINLCTMIVQQIRLADGRSIRDLVETQEAGSAEASVAVFAASRGQMKELHIFAYEAVKAHAVANGYDAAEAKKTALWAEIGLMQETGYNLHDHRYRYPHDLWSVRRNERRSNLLTECLRNNLLEVPVLHLNSVRYFSVKTMLIENRWKSVKFLYMKLLHSWICFELDSLSRQ